MEDVDEQKKSINEYIQTNPYNNPRRKTLSTTIAPHTIVITKGLSRYTNWGRQHSMVYHKRKNRSNISEAEKLESSRVWLEEMHVWATLQNT